MGKSSKVECKKVDFISESHKCAFCRTTAIDEIKYGPVYMHKNIITHYYCLLLSSNMEQNGRDCDGILGFLASDISKEVRRGSKLYCSYCRQKGATLGCDIAKCKVVFHLPCGLKHGTLHQFFGEFKSFCNKHRPVQKISESILAESSKGAMCGICYEKVIPRPVHDTLWAPCCQKSAFFHRDCVQKLATSAGYFFKCPLCNNVDTFQKAMKEFGIFIPEQDASWEQVPNAYQDLLVRHDSCDSTSCKCPTGRKTNTQGTRWELILCKFCGSQGVHIGCGRLKWKSPEFECEICISNTDSGATRTPQGDRHRLTGGERTPSVRDFSPPIDREVERRRKRSRSLSSDDSLPAVFSNRRRKVVSSASSSSATSPERAKHRARLRSSSPESHKQKTRLRTPSPGSHKQRRARRRSLSADSPKHRSRHRTPSPSQGSRYKRPADHQSGEFKTEHFTTSRPIVIDDSDDDLEVVGDVKTSSCLRTADGSTIPVVSVTSDRKRLRVVGDVKVKSPDQFVQEITYSKPKVPSPLPVKEVVYNLAPQQPSTSTGVSAPLPSTSFMLVDPASFRPQELPPNTVVYTSVQPIPQPVSQQLVSTFDGQLQLGSQHSDLSKHRRWSRNYQLTKYLKAHSEETSGDVKRDSSGRRRRRNNYNRLNPLVLLTPLKFQVTNNHLQIICQELEKMSAFKIVKGSIKAIQSGKNRQNGGKVDKKKRSKIKIKLSTLLNAGKGKSTSLTDKSKKKESTAIPKEDDDNEQIKTQNLSSKMQTPMKSNVLCKTIDSYFAKVIHFSPSSFGETPDINDTDSTTEESKKISTLDEDSLILKDIKSSSEEQGCSTITSTVDNLEKNGHTDEEFDSQSDTVLPVRESLNTAIVQCGYENYSEDSEVSFTIQNELFEHEVEHNKISETSISTSSILSIDIITTSQDKNEDSENQITSLNEDKDSEDASTSKLTEISSSNADIINLQFDNNSTFEFFSSERILCQKNGVENVHSNNEVGSVQLNSYSMDSLIEENDKGFTIENNKRDDQSLLDSLFETLTENDLKSQKIIDNLNTKNTAGEKLIDNETKPCEKSLDTECTNDNNPTVLKNNDSRDSFASSQDIQPNSNLQINVDENTEIKNKETSSNSVPTKLSGENDIIEQAKQKAIEPFPDRSEETESNKENSSNKTNNRSTGYLPSPQKSVPSNHLQTINPNQKSDKNLQSVENKVISSVSEFFPKIKLVNWPKSDLSKQIVPLKAKRNLQKKNKKNSFKNSSSKTDDSSKNNMNTIESYFMKLNRKSSNS